MDTSLKNISDESLKVLAEQFVNEANKRKIKTKKLEKEKELPTKQELRNLFNPLKPLLLELKVVLNTKVSRVESYKVEYIIYTGYGRSKARSCKNLVTSVQESPHPKEILKALKEVNLLRKDIHKLYSTKCRGLNLSQYKVYRLLSKDNILGGDYSSYWNIMAFCCPAIRYI